MLSDVDDTFMVYDLLNAWADENPDDRPRIEKFLIYLAGFPDAELSMRQKLNTDPLEAYDLALLVVTGSFDWVVRYYESQL